MSKSKLKFAGGAKSVTGSNFFLQIGTSGPDYPRNILVDCGLLQGDDNAREFNRRDFPYEPKDVDILLVTHAHIDHIGRIPKLVADGFAGNIYSTIETRELSKPMLRDAYSIMSQHARRDNLPTIYEASDIDKAFALWKTRDYQEEFRLGNDAVATFRDAGHILGSAIVVLERDGRRIAFSGDLGNSPEPLLRNTQYLKNVDYVVMESVYGDRNHDREDRHQELREIVEEVQERGHTMLMPAFSLERTQVLLFELNNLIEREGLEPIPVYVDSPLAIEVTEIFRNYTQNMNRQVQKQLQAGDEIFRFPHVKFTETTQDSKSIPWEGPKIIMAGSGMSHGGRILHHYKHYLDRSDVTVLIVGYQSPGSLGRKLLDGADRVRIFDEEIPVKAEVKELTGYSAHRDSDGLVDWASSFAPSCQEVFVTMGEEDSAQALKQRLEDELGVTATVPQLGEEVKIDF